MSGASADLFLDDRLSLHPDSAVAAILLLPDGRYLLQHRDNRAGIFFPDHWGCFGGSIEPFDRGRENGLQRELSEELGLMVDPSAIKYFTDFTFDMSFCEVGTIHRTFYEVRLGAEQIIGLHIREGSEFRAFTAREALGELRLAPYDAFALWMHAYQARLAASPRA